MTLLGRRLAATALLVMMAASAGAQAPFRITYNVERSASGRTRVAGQLFNDTPTDVVDVYVTAEALDASGKIVARGITFVSPVVRQGGSAPFEAAVPAPAHTASYRVRVSSYRQGFGDQAP